MQVWYPCTVATLSNQIKKVVNAYYAETATAGAEAGIDFVLNDFGFRGVSSVESAKFGVCSAHLLKLSPEVITLGRFRILAISSTIIPVRYMA